MTTKNSKNSSANLSTGLESAANSAAENQVKIDYSNLKWLQENNPAEFIQPENESITTKRYNAEREPKIVEGLILYAKLVQLATKADAKAKEGDEKYNLVLNPLVLELGRWWEVKPARAEIKKMIESEAKAKGYPVDVYMQETLKNELSGIIGLSDASSRLSYAINYFKPRRELTKGLPTQQIKIDGELYEIEIAKLTETKAKYPKAAKDSAQKAQLKAELLEIARPVSIDIEEI